MAELAEYAALQSEVNALQKELAAYGRCDPVRVEEKRVAVGTAKEAVGRWTGECLPSCPRGSFCACMNLLARHVLVIRTDAFEQISLPSHHFTNVWTRMFDVSLDTGAFTGAVFPAHIAAAHGFFTYAPL